MASGINTKMFFEIANGLVKGRLYKLEKTLNHNDLSTRVYLVLDFPEGMDELEIYRKLMSIVELTHEGN